MIALRGNEFEGVASFKAVFDFNGQPAILRVGIDNFTDKLLLTITGGPFDLVLIGLGHVAAVEALGVTAIGEVVEFTH